MAATIPAPILGLRGQCVKSVNSDEDAQALVFHCDRDRRFVPVDHRTGSRGTVNRRLRRQVRDLPLWGRPVTLSIGYCQLKIGATDRPMERLPFVEPHQAEPRRRRGFARAHTLKTVPKKYLPSDRDAFARHPYRSAAYREAQPCQCDRRSDPAA